MKKILILSCLYLLTYSVQAEIYKWVDDQGRTHYGDKPTESSKEIEVNTQKKDLINTGESREERRQKLLDSFDEDRARKNEEKEKQKQAKEKHMRQCAFAKDRLRRYERAGYLYNLDKDGNRVVISKEERKQTVDGLRDNIKKYCK